MSVKLLSEKVSFSETPESLQILILGKIERWKEAMLTAWLLAWIFCGAVVFKAYLSAADRDMKMVTIIFLSFWVYYLWRVGRVWLFRRGGNELIKVDSEKITLKRSFYTYGKSRHYHLTLIKEFSPIKLSKTSFAYSYENGWWVLGGEKLGFKYQNRFVKFGMQMGDDVRDRVYSLMQKKIVKLTRISRESYAAET